MSCSAQAGRRESHFGGPAVGEPTAQGIYGDAEMAGPVGEHHGLVVQCVTDVTSLVSSLLRRGSPSAITRLVVTFVVDSIEGVRRRRSWPHVSEEVFECLPAFADTNAAPAIVPVIGRPRILASRFHVAPHSPLGGHGCPVPNRSDAHQFALQASARSGLATREPVGRASNLSATRTSAHPGDAASVQPVSRNRGKPTEVHTSDVASDSHAYRHESLRARRQGHNP